jgi:mono/diheme cytochrome c family protein
MRVRVRTVLLGLLALVIVLLLGGITAIGWQIVLGPTARAVTDRRIEATPERLARGRYLVNNVAACFHCHSEHNFTDPEYPMVEGKMGAGWELPIPELGHVIAPNITPDPETGIGAWTDAEIIAAIREGRSRRGGVLAPVMPYYRYAGMADRDVADLVAYLRTLPAVRRPNQAAEVTLPLRHLAYRAWRLLFAPRISAPAEAPTEPLAHGRYLADAVAICADCHTPRDRFGAPVADMYLAGTDHGPGGDPVPNITSDVATGIGKWREGAIVTLLQTGMLPNADNVQGLMAGVVEGVGSGPGYAQAPEPELRSIAKYLKTVPPVSHEIHD